MNELQEQSVLVSINLASSITTTFQLIQSIVVADYRQALSYQGNEEAAKRVILPCYRPLIIGLAICYIFLALYQVLILVFLSSIQNTWFVLALERFYALAIQAIYSIVPLLFIQKSVSLKGFYRSLLLFIPWLSVTSVILLLEMILQDIYGALLSLGILLAITTSVPIYLSLGILSGKIACRVQLKSVSNRNAIELLLIYSVLFVISNISSTCIFGSTGSRNNTNYSDISVYICLFSLISNLCFPYALYRGLLADTKFWRGLGKHNQGGISNGGEISILDDITISQRPTASTIELSIASNSFQKMMSDISSITIDFAYVQVDRRIGEGATSEVYCGRYSNVVVAIKVSTPPDITPDILEVFSAEAKTCSQLKHNNIVKFHGICVRPPQIGMVFELCEGGNLRLNLKKHPKKWTRALRIRGCLHAAEALAYLHSKGFIHRDIKAENFFVTRRMVVKLGDFGEVTKKRSKESTAIRRMTVLGTVSHMAPELVAAERYYTEAIDIYALALTFWEIWTGQDPYDDLNHFDIYKQVNKGSRPQIPADMPTGLKSIIERAWHQDYTLRPSARDIADELQDFLFELTGTTTKLSTTSNDSNKNSRKSKDTFDVVDNIEYSPAELIDPRKSGRFAFARFIIRTKQFFNLNNQEDSSSGKKDKSINNNNSNETNGNEDIYTMRPSTIPEFSNPLVTGIESNSVVSDEISLAVLNKIQTNSLSNDNSEIKEDQTNLSI